MAYRSMGDGEKSRAVAATFLERNPENSTAHASLGAALVGLGRYEDALREYTRAGLLEPADAGLQVERAAVLVLREDWEAAAEAARTMYAG